MANNFDAIKELTNGKNTMTLTNAVMRAYGIPLDYSSVQESYEVALEYAKTSAKAYIGQPISIGDTLYIVTDEANGYLKAVGTKPVGDNASIEVAEDGKISIYGFAAAEGAALPRKKLDGTIEWVAIEDIVIGDGNEKTRVVAAEGSDITVTPSYDETNDTYTYTLDVVLPAVPGYSVTKTVGEGAVTYQLTKDGVAEGEAIVVPNAYDDSDLASRVSAVEATAVDHTTRIENIEAFFAGAAADEGEGESLVNALDTLKEIQEYINADGKVAETVASNAAAITTLNGDKDTVGSVAHAIAAQAAVDAGTYATQAALAEVKATADAAAVKSDVDTELAKKVESAEIAHTSTGVTEGVTKEGTTLKIVVDAFTKEETLTKIDEKITSFTGGESAADVKNALDTYKETNDAAVAALQSADTTHSTNIQKNADDIAAILNETTGILAQAKADAQSKVNALANGAVATNANNISAIDGKITNINENIAGHTTAIAALEQKDTDITAAINAEKAAREALAGVVGGHTTELAGLTAKDTELAALITANTNKFANYSTTSEVEAKIAEAVGAIDYTAINKALDDNAKAISDEATRADTEEKRLAGLIAENATAIGTNAAAIAALDAVVKAAIENEDSTALNSIKELAIWVAEHETEVLPAIEDNTKAIAALNGDGEGSVKKTVADAIAAIPATPVATTSKAGVVKASEEVTVAEDGTMGVGYISTDKLIQGSATLVLNGGNAEVKVETPAEQ